MMAKRLFGPVLVTGPTRTFSAGSPKNLSATNANCVPVPTLFPSIMQVPPNNPGDDIPGNWVGLKKAALSTFVLEGVEYTVVPAPAGFNWMVEPVHTTLSTSPGAALAGRIALIFPSMENSPARTEVLPTASAAATTSSCVVLI